jgi:2-oxoglutarate ferredoxin oxidoreductase subunit delta
MAMIRGTVLVEAELCKGCELCIVACPQECMGLGEELNKKGYRAVKLTDATKCTGCENCALVCPDAVLTVYREPKKSRQSRTEQVAA